MRRSLAATWLRFSVAATAAALGAVLVVPGSASAANEPTFTVPGASYSNQPRPFAVNVKNNLAGGRVIASLSNGSLDAEMSCSGSGTGTWTCTLGAHHVLSPGTVRVHAQSVDEAQPNRDTNVVTRSGSITSRLSASGTRTVEGEPFNVTGRYDHLNGVNDYRVNARVTNGGKVVKGQSNVPCTVNPPAGTYRCALQSALGASDPSSRYAVTVTEVSARTGDRRSVSTAVTVTAIKGPDAPRILGPSSVKGTDQPVTVTGDAGKPGLRVEVTVDSTSFATPAAVCTTGADRTWSCALPAEYGDGTHTIRARVSDPAVPGKSSPTATRVFVVAADATPTPTPTPSPTAAAPATPTSTPSATPSPEPTAPAAAPVGPRTERDPRLPAALDALLALLILGLAIITMIRPDTLGLAPDGSSAALTDAEEAEDHPGVGPGDQWPIWASPGQEALDAWSRTAPLALAGRSPFLGRLLLDGSDVRAVFGSLWWLLVGSGLTLGLALGAQGGALSTALVVAILVLGVADATAGFLAAVAFGGMLLVGGSVGTEAAFLTILGLGTLWVAPSLVGNAIRPFRRQGRVSVRLVWDRAADVVVAGVLAGWLALLVARSMDALARTETGIPEQATVIGLITFVAIGARIALAHVADVWFPERRQLTDVAEELPPPTPLALYAGTVIRTGVLALAGHAFLGTCWQWVVGVLLFALPDVVLAFRESAFLAKVSYRLELPRGLTSVLLVVITSGLLVVAAVAGPGSDLGRLRLAFLAAALVPALFSLVKVFNDEPEPKASTWPLQAAGGVVVAASVFLALHGVDF